MLYLNCLLINNAGPSSRYLSSLMDLLIFHILYTSTCVVENGRGKCLKCVGLFGAVNFFVQHCLYFFLIIRYSEYRHFFMKTFIQKRVHTLYLIDMTKFNLLEKLNIKISYKSSFAMSIKWVCFAHRLPCRRTLLSITAP